MDRLIG